MISTPIFNNQAMLLPSFDPVIIVMGFATAAKQHFATQLLVASDIKKYDCVVLEPTEDILDWIDQNDMSETSRCIDTVVVVLDISTFWWDLNGDVMKNAPDVSEGRTILEIVMAQVERCDVVLWSQTELNSNSAIDLKTLQNVVAALNPHAKQMCTDLNGGIDWPVFPFGRFDDELTLNGSAYSLAVSRGISGHVVQHSDSGVCTWIWQRDRPLHPARFWTFLHSGQLQAHGRLIRSCGYFWLASRLDLAGSWNQTGLIARHGVAGFWDDEPPRQELMFMGIDLDVHALTSVLDACLLTPEEYVNLHDKPWLDADPFPEWLEDDNDHIHD
jgi:G3E family GTPase